MIRESNGCNRSNEKKLDGLKWQVSDIWHFIHVLIRCANYTQNQAGDAAKIRENSKNVKYATLEDNFHFISIAIETLGWDHG